MGKTRKGKELDQKLKRRKARKYRRFKYNGSIQAGIY